MNAAVVNDLILDLTMIAAYQQKPDLIVILAAETN